MRLAAHAHEAKMVNIIMNLDHRNYHRVQYSTGRVSSFLQPRHRMQVGADTTHKPPVRKTLNADQPRTMVVYLSPQQAIDDRIG